MDPSTPVVRIALALINLAISVALAALLRHQGVVTEDYQAVLVTIGLFQLGLLVELVLQSARIRGKERLALREEERIQIGRDVMRRLDAALRTLAVRASGNRDLFLAYFAKGVGRLADEAEIAVQKGQLRVVAEHFLYLDNVLDAMTGQQHKVWRYTWCVNGGEQLFDDLHWRSYFERTAHMSENGQFDAIRCLLIVDHLNTVRLDPIIHLLRYFKGAKGMCCKAIRRAEYDHVAADYKLTTQHLDFGIYGDRLIFRSERFEPEIAGEFSTDRVLIESYTKMFDRMWEFVAADVLEEIPDTERIGLPELLKLDAKVRV